MKDNDKTSERLVVFFFLTTVHSSDAIDRQRGTLSLEVSKLHSARGPQNKVGKGSRQNRSVTSDKDLSLRIGSKSPRLRIGLARKLLDRSRCRVDFRLVKINGQGTPLAIHLLSLDSNTMLLNGVDTM